MWYNAKYRYRLTSGPQKGGVKMLGIPPVPGVFIPLFCFRRCRAYAAESDGDATPKTSVEEEKMNREFLKNAGVPEDQIDKVMAEYGKDLQAEKDKAKAASAELETYKAKVTDLEKAAEGNDAVKKELDDLKAKIADEKKAAEEKAADEALTATIKAAFPQDKKFVNEYTEAAMIREIKAEMSKAENRGKGVTEIFSALTKDKAGIFANPNEIQPLPPMGDPKPEGSNEAAMRRIFGLEKKD